MSVSVSFAEVFVAFVEIEALECDEERGICGRLWWRFARNGGRSLREFVLLLFKARLAFCKRFTYIARSPSPDFVGSSLPEGAFVTCLVVTHSLSVAYGASLRLSSSAIP